MPEVQSPTTYAPSGKDFAILGSVIKGVSKSAESIKKCLDCSHKHSHSRCSSGHKQFELMPAIDFPSVSFVLWSQALHFPKKMFDLQKVGD
jgi:hypothetical protein